jgi:hypothetical protein
MDAEKVFTKVGVPFGVGALGGVVDHFGSMQDAKNIQTAKAAGKEQSVFSQYGTYINYLVPAVEVVAAAAGWVKDEHAAMLATQAGALAGSKIIRNMTVYPFGKGKNYTMSFSTTPSQWTRDNRPYILQKPKALPTANPAKMAETYTSINPAGIITGEVIQTRGM